MQHRTGTPIPCSPLTHFRFQDPYFVSITFLFSILTLTLDSIFGTPYAAWASAGWSSDMMTEVLGESVIAVTGLPLVSAGVSPARGGGGA